MVEITPAAARAGGSIQELILRDGRPVRLASAAASACSNGRDACYYPTSAPWPGRAGGALLCVAGRTIEAERSGAHRADRATTWPATAARPPDTTTCGWNTLELTQQDGHHTSAERSATMSNQRHIRSQHANGIPLTIHRADTVEAVLSPGQMLRGCGQRVMHRADRSWSATRTTQSQSGS